MKTQHGIEGLSHSSDGQARSVRGLVANVISSFITGLVVVCPLLLAVVCALPNFFGGWGLVWDGHPYDFYFLPDIKHHLLGGVALACVWGMCFVLFCRSRFFADTRHLPLKLFLITLVSRGLIALTIGQFASPFSDFAFAWDRACTGCFNPEYSSHLLCPTWMAFSMFEHFWVRLFGSNMGFALLSSAIFNAVTAVMIYHFAMYVFKQSRIALVAASIYVFYPSSIVYTLTASPEHMGIACFMVMAVLLAKCISDSMTIGRRLLLVAAAGVVAGFGNSVKPIFMLYAIAGVICFCVASLRNENRQCCLWMKAFGMLLFLGVEMATVSSVLSCAESVFNVSFRRVDPTPHYLCVGLNRQGEGQIHVGTLSRMWAQLVLEEGAAPANATRNTYDAVVRDWESHVDDIVPFFMKKSVWAWQDDNRTFGLAMLQLGKGIGGKILNDGDRDAMAARVVKRELGDNFVTPSTDEKCPSPKAQLLDSTWQTVQTAGFTFYFVIMFLSVVSALLCRRRQVFNVPYLWSCLSILGFWGLMVVSESASRYKCIAMPYVFVLTAPLIAELIFRGWDYRHETI